MGDPTTGMREDPSRNQWSDMAPRSMELEAAPSSNDAPAHLMAPDHNLVAYASPAPFEGTAEDCLSIHANHVGNSGQDTQLR